MKRRTAATAATPSAIIYARVSTTRQADEGVSLDAQEARARAWAVANGREVAAVHVDAGLSGGRADNRPALQAAVDLACATRSALVVYSLSRLARSTRDAIEIAGRLEDSGADLVSCSESIDTTGAVGRMVFRMLATLAEFERDLTAERTSAALQHKRSRGERVGNTPYGWRVGDDGVRLVRDEVEQGTIRRITDLRDHGLTLAQIAARLNAEGRTSRTGGPWLLQSVARVLRANPGARVVEAA